MKAVNLVPREARLGTGALSGLGIGTTAIFAALGLGLALSVAYVILANGVTSRKDQLNKLNQQSNATVAEVNSLKPYADLESLRESLLDRVRALADGRYDWPTTLSRIARALPSDTTLTSFNGSGSGSSSGSAPAATPGAAATPSSGPTIGLSGCTPSHDAVAGVIDRLRSVNGVASVSLQSSTVSASSDAASGTGCSGSEQFKLTVQMAAPAAPAPAATGAAAGAPASPGTTSTTPSTPSPASSPTASTGAAPGGNS